MSEELQGLPMDLEAEACILGTVLDDGNLFQRIAASLDPGDFAIEKHRRVYSAMGRLHQSGANIDRVSVLGLLKDAEKDGLVGGLSGLLDLDGSLGQVMGLDAYCRRVKDKAVLRKTIAVASKLIADCQNNGDSRDVLDRADRMVRELTAETARDRRLVTAGEIVAQHGGLDAFLTATKASVPTPFADLNGLLGGGFREQELVLLAARTSVGKTAAALQIAEYAASRGIGTALYSLEMSNKQVLHRMACGRARVDSNAFRFGRLSKEQRQRLVRAIGEIQSFPLYFDDTAGCTVPGIHASVRRLRAKADVGFVVIDYLQLIQPVGRFGNRQEAVSDISRNLKLAAKDFNVPFLVLAQLSRAAEDGEEPKLHHLRESGSQEQDADIVMFIWRTGDPYGTVIPARISLGKQRNGPLDKVDLSFVSQYGRFEGATNEEEQGAA